MIDETKCQEIRDWAWGLHSPLELDARIVVDHGRAEGDPLMDTEHREIRVHPRDYLALQRWADQQAIAA